MSNRRSNLALPLILLAVVGALLWWWRSSPSDTDAETGDDAGAGPAIAGSGASRPSTARAPMGALDLLGDPGGSIRGKITAPDGTPIAGADVCARTHDRELGSAQTREPRCVRSEADGSYRIEGLWRVRWGVGAAARGHIPASWGEDEDESDGVRLDRQAEASGIDIVLEPGGVEVTGVVRDLGGGEIEGAFVSGTHGKYWRPAGGWGAITRTDAEGKFTLWVEDGDVSVQAHAEGYTEAQESGIAPGMHFTLVLTPESVLAGVVRDPTGKPVAGATVTAGGTEFFSRGSSAISGEDGRYRIDRLGPGRYKPSAKADGFEGLAKESVRLGIGESLDPVDVIVHPAALVAATVSVEGGGMCPEGWMQLHDAQTQARYSASIDDGAAKFPAVRPGTYAVSISCTDHASADEYPDVEVGDESITDLAYQVTKGRSIRGVIVDAQGKGVRDASVYVQLDSVGRGTPRQSFDQPDDDGRFEVQGLVPGTYSVNAWTNALPDPIEPLKVEVPESGEPEEVRIQLEAGGRILGTVKDADGRPASGIEVHARGPQSESAPVRDDGTFEIEGLRAGDYRVTARGSWWGDQLRKPGAHDDDVQGEPATVTAGGVAEIELVVESRAGKIEGTVVDEAGGPLADAYIAVTRESESAAAAAGRAKQQSRWTWGRDPILSDVDGRFVAEELADGKYTVRAYRKGGGEGLVEGVEVGKSVEVRIEVEGSISGTVTIEGGGAPARFHVTIVDPTAGFRRSEEFARTDGAWAIREVPAGTYELVVSAAEGVAELKDLGLKAGEEREGVALTLEGRTTIRGRVVALDTGEPIEGLVVTASRRGAGMSISFGQKRGKEVTAADGTYELENAPSGRISLHTFPLSFTDFDSVGRGSVVLDAEAGEVVQAPDILVPPKRVGRGAQPGDLGFAIKQTEPGAELDNHPKVVALVRPGGPAAATELKVGDVIVSVDGHDVTGANTGLYGGLTEVPEGTTVELGIQGGTEVRITAGPPV